FDALDNFPRQRCNPIAIVTPIGTVSSMLSAASFNELRNGCRSESSCHTDCSGSVKYQRHDGDWNVDRLLPELKEIRMAISTGSNEHKTYSHVTSARPRAG